MGEKKAEDERLAAERNAEEERLATEQKAEEECLAAERNAQIEQLAAELKAKVKNNGSNTQSQKLTVQARVARRVVSYDIYCGDEGKSEILKSTRYSELSRLHEDVMREVPEFRGQLPPKTLLRRTSAAFVESRRVDIQAYLRAIAMDTRVWQSKAFKSFFQAPQANTSSTWPEDAWTHCHLKCKAAD